MLVALKPFLPYIRFFGAFVVLAFLLSQYRSCTSSPPSQPHIVSVDTVHRKPDTVRLVSPPDTVTITQVRTRTVYRDAARGPIATLDTTADGRIDTVLICESFVAPFDTTVSGYRLRGLITNPPLGLKDVSITSPPDTSLRISQPIEIRTVIERPRPWYETFALAGGGFAAGYLTRMGVESLSSAPDNGSGMRSDKLALISIRF